MTREDVYNIMMKSEICNSCPLHGSDIVLWEKLYSTNEQCDIMFFGINPGREEAVQKRPFIGRSGKLLRERIEALGLSKFNVVFSNAILCSTSNESKIPDIKVCIDNCRYYTKEIENLFHPVLKVAVGKQCANVYFGINGSMGEMNGQLYDNVVPIVHPSFVIRMPSDKNKEMLDYGLKQVLHYVNVMKNNKNSHSCQ